MDGCSVTDAVVKTHQSLQDHTLYQPASHVEPLPTLSTQSSSSTIHPQKKYFKKSEYPKHMIARKHGQNRTFVIFAIFLTDLRRSSSSRNVAMLRAFGGAAAMDGC